MEATLQITDKEFIAQHDSFFELADSGKPLLIRWGENRYFHLMSATIPAAPAADVANAASEEEELDVYEPEDDGFCYAPGLLKRIEAARQQFLEGKYTVCHTKEESIKFLESL